MAPNLLQASDRQHLMLIYDGESARNAAEVDCINEGLRLGQFCVYASVDVQDEAFMSKMSARIHDYDRQVREGNLLIVNFIPFYASAAKAELTLFRRLKEQIESTIKGRIASGKNGKTLVVADAACNLSKHKQFDECVTLESWWQEIYMEWAKNKLDITIICAHPSTILEQHLHEEDRGRISDVHSLTIYLREFSRPTIKNDTKPYKPIETKPIRILIAEPEPDILTTYERYFRSLLVDVTIVAEGNKCLEQALLSKGFDVVLVDTHLKDLSGIEVAKKILEERPDQHIILTTTTIDPRRICDHLQSDSFDVSRVDILVKPFIFSQLLALIKPAKSTLTS